MNGTAKNGTAKLTVRQRHQARGLAYTNGGIWALGNGCVSSMLVVYLAMEYDVPGFGLAISLILAAPRLTGLLRMLTPMLIEAFGDRKRFCIGAYLASGLVLLGLPVVAAPNVSPSAAASLYALVALWCTYHLFEYLGTVALWSWLADLVPLRIRGRFFGVRQRWMVTGQAVAMLAAGLFKYRWDQAVPDTMLGYAIPAGLGACLMIAAMVPLAKMPNVTFGGRIRREVTFATILGPLRNRPFLRLVLFGCWFSFFNGVTQLTQSIYPWKVLGIGLFFMLAMKVGMRAGQFGISPGMGRLADRLGNRRVMLVALPIVALGPLFYFFSGPRQPEWVAQTLVAMAWVVWIAYAGINVCLPNLMLKLSPRESNTPYIAAYYSISGLMMAVGTILGGTLYDKIGDWRFLMPGGMTLDYFHANFLFGWITRTLGVLVLLWVIEPAGPKQ